MVKKCLLLLTVFLLLIFSGCADSSGASAGKIIPPSNQVCPLSGAWTVIQELGANGNTENATQQWVGSTVQFAGGIVEFDGHAWNGLSYKIKRVDAHDYLMTKYISSACIDFPENKKVDVITIYAATNFLGEVMKIDDTRMIFIVPNNELLLEKASDRADIMADNDQIYHPDLNWSSSKGASGVLLGLRAPSGNGYTYRTLWIAADHQQLHPVLVSDELFFPRTSGFWELRVRNIDVNGKTGSTLTACNAAPKTLETKTAAKKIVAEERDHSISTDSAVRMIHYIGNDYVSVEKENNGICQLQMLPVDKLTSPTEIKLSDLLGEKGLDAFRSARDLASGAVKSKGDVQLESDEFGENFGLIRKNGHWLLMGRINYQRNGAFEYEDFDLKIVPPANLIFYDTLVLNWHNIKDRVPDALDAFTSPDKDIALVKTKNKLTVYTIGAEHLAENPLAEIELQEGEAIIMSEWATSSYVDSWEKSFLAYGAQALPNSSVRIH